MFRNKVQAVKLFIDASSSLDIPDLRAMVILDYALQFNYDEVMLELVKGGARLGFKQKKGIEIMHFAALKGDINLIRALVKQNVPLSCLDEGSGMNCLMTALYGK